MCICCLTPFDSEVSSGHSFSECQFIDQLYTNHPPAGKNAEVQYSLLPGPHYDLFSVHPQTGQVTTTTQLDREQQQTFTLRGSLLLLTPSPHPPIPHAS